MKTKTGVTVCDAMTKRPIIAKPDEGLERLAREMAHHHVGSLVVMKDKKLVGIVTEPDIIRKVIAKNKNPYKLKAKDIMEKKVVTIGPEQDIYDALVLMKRHDIRHLPVMDSKKMVGFLTIKDILKIEPQLFEIMVEKFELREEEKKPVRQSLEGKEEVCEFCGAVKRY